MKILIVGALGYDGAGLIESYRNDPEHEVILLDKLFVPHLLANLPGHFRYVQGNILDTELVKSLMKGVDVVYLLAAEVEAEKSINKERAIWENNYEGALNVIDNCPEQTRIVFASSANVFGGVLETEKNMDITEEDEPRPKYPYAESKRAVEKHLIKTGRNYVIVRFGTHFGYTPGIRFNLVTNIFFKKAMMGENLTVHGSGDNYRPTLCAKDAVGGMRHLAEHPEAGGEIFHLIGKCYRIRELAQEVAGVFPGCKVENVLKEVPFNSYHLSNEKVKRFGYEFQYTIPKALEEMKEIFSAIAVDNK
jgi:nucleoside-diphosphate-sugar epimerase